MLHVYDLFDMKLGFIAFLRVHWSATVFPPHALYETASMTTTTDFAILLREGLLFGGCGGRVECVVGVYRYTWRNVVV